MTTFVKQDVLSNVIALEILCIFLMDSLEKLKRELSFDGIILPFLLFAPKTGHAGAHVEEEQLLECLIPHKKY